METLRSHTVQRTLLIFIASLVFGLALFENSLTQQVVVKPLCIQLASGVREGLGLLGIPVQQFNEGLVKGTFGISIDPACSGLIAAVVFIAGVVAFPGRVSRKVWAILLGMLSLYLLNLLRLGTLLLIGAQWPAGFDWAHVYIGRPLNVVVICALWVALVDYFILQKEVVK